MFGPTYTRLALLVAGLLLSAETSARKITVKNSCGVKVFAAYSGQGGSVQMGGKPAPAGWEIPEGKSTTLDVPENWASGRIWIRSGGEGCANDVSKCLLGKCKSGGLACDGSEYGTVGVTLAEFSLNKHANQDFYDVSMVEGLTVPVTVTPSEQSCTVGSCGIEADPLMNCDSRLVYPKGQDKIWSCANPCTAGVQFTALGHAQFDYLQSPSCCLGAWKDGQCTHDVIPFYSELKKLCKLGYIYAKDDLPFGDSQSAVWSCPADKHPSYTVEFCAGGRNSALVNPPSVAKAVKLSPGPKGALNVGGGGDVPAPSQPGKSSIAKSHTGPSKTLGFKNSAAPSKPVQAQVIALQDLGDDSPSSLPSTPDSVPPSASASYVQAVSSQQPQAVSSLMPPSADTTALENLPVSAGQKAVSSLHRRRRGHF